MPVTVNMNIEDLMNDLVKSVEVASDQSVQEASEYLYNDVMNAFKDGGPGWKPLEQKTIEKKRLNRSSTPSEILREFDVMKDSIEIKDTSSMKLSAVKTTETITTVTPSETGVLTRITKTRNKLLTFISRRFQRSIGIFSDTQKNYNLHTQGGFRGPIDAVKRGTIHEFGGIEKQQKRIGIEEIRTGGLSRKALKGEGEVIDKAREVRKKGKTSKITKFVKIPARSFLRMPFDRSLQKMMEIIKKKFDQVIGDL